MGSRIVGAFALPVESAGFSLSAGTFGGGSGGLTPRKVCRNHLPRVDRRGARGVRRHRQQRALAEQAAAHVELRRQRHAAELRAVDVRDAVVLGQPLVDEGVIRGQQIEDAAILVDDAVEEQLDLALEGRRAGCRRNPGTG